MKPNKTNTDKVSISLSKDINQRLSDYCNEKLVNKSKLINRLVSNFLDEITIEKNKSKYAEQERN